ncbi:MAG: hypothetical protein P8N02_00405, partial [Actinomycetota bacterium]|nr:hypothetical protein [Actinomycetota bacterium]
AALEFARRGHRVTVLERDDTPTPVDVEAAFAWDRRGAPQVRHSHALLGRLHNLLRDEHPAVLERLLDAGATEIRLAEHMPDTLDDRTPQPGDDNLVMLAARRTTFEWVLRQVAVETGGVEIFTGQAVSGLHLGASIGTTPRVDGVVTADGTMLNADIVVAANGRRSTAPDWLGAMGITTPEEEVEDTGIVYYSRFYRLTAGHEFPAGDRLIGGDLTYLKYGVFWGDNDTFSITLATADDDRTLRAVKDPLLFDRVTSMLPATADWLSGKAEPITEVHSMAGLINRRRFTSNDGEPLVAGFHSIGDALVATNPLYGRGCALGFWQAHLLSEVIAEHADPLDQATAFGEAIEEHIVPWYQASAQSDRSSRKALARSRAEAAGEDLPELDGDDMMRSVLREGLSPASRTDAVVWRAFMAMMNLLATPRSLMEPEIANRVFAVWQDHGNRPKPAPLGPPRAELLAELSLSDDD